MENYIQFIKQKAETEKKKLFGRIEPAAITIETQIVDRGLIADVEDGVYVVYSEDSFEVAKSLANAAFGSGARFFTKASQAMCLGQYSIAIWQDTLAWVREIQSHPGILVSKILPTESAVCIYDAKKSFRRLAKSVRKTKQFHSIGTITLEWSETLPKIISGAGDAPRGRVAQIVGALEDAGIRLALTGRFAAQFSLGRTMVSRRAQFLAEVELSDVKRALPRANIVIQNPKLVFYDSLRRIIIDGIVEIYNAPTYELVPVIKGRRGNSTICSLPSICWFLSVENWIYGILLATGAINEKIKITLEKGNTALIAALVEKITEKKYNVIFPPNTIGRKVDRIVAFKMAQFSGKRCGPGIYYPAIKADK